MHANFLDILQRIMDNKYYKSQLKEQKVERCEVIFRILQLMHP